MIILDTHVISELFRKQPEVHIVSWLKSDLQDVAITSITVAELLSGIRRLPDGQRKFDLWKNINETLQLYWDTNSILPFDGNAANYYAEILEIRDKLGLPISMANAQIAAICRAHSAICATRNIEDFAHTGIQLLNPWKRAKGDRGTRPRIGASFIEIKGSSRYSCCSRGPKGASSVSLSEVLDEFGL